MPRLHCWHLKSDIDAFTKSAGVKVVDKQALLAELMEKWSIKPSLAEKMADILVYVADKESVSSPRRDSLSPSVETGTAHICLISEPVFRPSFLIICLLSEIVAAILQETDLNYCCDMRFNSLKEYKFKIND